MNSLVPQQPKPFADPLFFHTLRLTFLLSHFLFVVSCSFFAECCAESEGERKILKKAHGSGYSSTSKKYPFECTGSYKRGMSIIGDSEQAQHVSLLYFELSIEQSYYVNRGLYSRQVGAKLLLDRQA